MSRESALALIQEKIQNANTPDFISPNTMSEVLREIVNILPKYSIYKASYNLAPTLEAGDVIAGLWNDSMYIVARFLGGDDEN